MRIQLFFALVALMAFVADGGPGNFMMRLWPAMNTGKRENVVQREHDSLKVESKKHDKKLEWVMRQYERYWRKGVNESNSIGAMSLFVITMIEVGPEITPSLIELLAKRQEIEKSWFFEAIRHIDNNYDTKEYVELLLDDELRYQVRKAALVHIIDKDGKSIAESLRKISCDVRQALNRRKQAIELRIELLSHMAMMPNITDEERDWARDVLRLLKPESVNCNCNGSK